eukprot:8767787-Heterocapsa_arctica.AAC.1
MTTMKWTGYSVSAQVLQADYIHAVLGQSAAWYSHKGQCGFDIACTCGIEDLRNCLQLLNWRFAA